MAQSVSFHFALLGTFFLPLVCTASIPLNHVDVSVLEGASASKSLELIEKKVERWLENRPELSAVAELKPARFNESFLREEQQRKKLMTLTQSLRARLRQGEGDDELVLRDRLTQARKSLEHVRRLGPDLESALLMESISYWKQGRHEEAKSLLLSIVNLVPDRIPHVVDWDENYGGVNLASMDAEIHRLASRARRQCSLDITLVPKQALLKINGFAITQPHVELIVGETYEIEGSLSRYRPTVIPFSCSRVQRQRLTLELKPMALASSGSANGPTLLITSQGAEVRLFLYSSWVGLDPVPLSRPILLSSADDLSSGSLPILADAFVHLFEKHRFGTLPHFSSLSGSPVMETEVPGKTSLEWYNNWKVWAIAGTISAAIITGYLFSRDHQVGGTPQRLKVKFD